jgi:hypothetical protein
MRNGLFRRMLRARDRRRRRKRQIEQQQVQPPLAARALERRRL